MRIVRLDHHCSVVGHGAGLFEHQQHIDGLVLQRLEGADGDAKLFARLEIVDGERMQRLHRPDGLRRDRGDTGFNGAFENRKAAAHGAERFCFDIGQNHVGKPPAVLRFVAGNLYTSRIGRNDKERDTIFVALTA
jgi:hypothetical protein